MLREVMKRAEPRPWVCEELEKLFPRSKFSCRLSDRVVYSKDYWPITHIWFARGEIPALPDAVVWPETLEDVVSLVKLAYEKEVPLVPYGGGSGVLGAAVPEKGGIVVDMKRFRGIRIHEKDLMVEVGAGVIGAELEEYLNSKGYTMGNIPQSLYSSAVGGWISTKATGQFSTKYGGIEDMLLGIQAVIPPGTVVELKPHPRTATAFDLRKLFVGAEGTIGLITKAYFKIWPFPERRHLLAFLTDDIESALEAVRRILQRGARPAVVRVFDRVETIKWYHGFKGTKGKIATILIVEGDAKLADVEAEIVREEFRKVGAKEAGKELVEHWLAERFNVSEMSEFVPLGFVIDTIEVAAPWSRAAELYHKVIEAIRSVSGTIVAYAHASHFYPQGACFYFIFAGYPKERSPDDYYNEVWSAAMRATLESGGTISHHHGIGRMRARWLKDELGPGGYEMLMRVKKAIDERNIMNPDVWG